MQVQVELPSGPLIPYWAFCRAIADAVGPRYKDLEGIDCVSEKIYPPDVPPPNFSIAGPYPLEDADRQALSKVLVKLPRLHYPMPEEEVASFMEAYVNLPKRPEWIPFLVNEKTVLGRKNEYEQIADRHLKALREEHKAGRIVPVSADHTPLNAVEIGAYLTRKDAIAYLARHGLAYDDKDARGSPGSPVESSTAVGKAILSPSDRETIPKLHAQWVAEGRRKPTALLAEKYGVSERWIRKVIEEAKAMKPSPQSYLERVYAKRG